MKRMCFFALLLAAVNCTKKPTGQRTAPNILDQICAIETERHGEHPNPPIREFGNEIMDLYADSAKDEAALWKAFKHSRNICRGAYLQLYFDVFPKEILTRWQSAKGSWTAEDRIRLTYLVYSRKRTDLSDLVMDLLAHAPEVEVRESAALALSILPQKKMLKPIATLIKNEDNPRVLTAIVLALDFEEDPKAAALIEPLLATEHIGVAQALITTIAISELENKRSYLEQLSQSSHTEIAQSAQAALDGLETKPKLDLTLTGIHTSVPGTRPYNRQLQHELLEAILAENFLVVEDLLSKGARLDMGRTPRLTMLHELINWDGPEASIRWIIDHGVDLEAKDKSGMTAFMSAAINASPNQKADYLSILQAAGSDIHAINGIGETALHIAARLNRYRAVEKLLRLGANPSLRDGAGRTPGNIAALLGHDEVAALLRKSK